MQILAHTLGVNFDPQANELARWPKILMGFVSKGIESADQLLLEGDRDTGPRGQRMRELGLKIINSFVRIVPMAPPAGTGFNLLNGKPDCQSERNSYNQRTFRGNTYFNKCYSSREKSGA